MRKLHTVLILLGLMALAFLVWKIGLMALWHKLASLGTGLILLILGEGLAEAIHALGWRHCLTNASRSLPFTYLFRIRITGYAINYLTPTATLGGEMVKAALLASKSRTSEAVSSVLIDKVCLAVAHLLLLATGGVIILWHIQLPRPLWWGMLISSTLIATGVMAFLLLQKYGKLGVVIRWLAERQIGGHTLQKLAGHITEVDMAMSLFYREHPRDLILATSWHLLGHAIGLLQTWLFLGLLNQNTPLGTVAGAWLLGMWFDLPAFMVPLSLGTLEASRILALKAVGFNALLGMTYGVTLRLGQLFWAAVGLVFYALLALQPSNRRNVPVSPLCSEPE